jgi:endonuclease YncB( thermonuclease family)
MRPIKRFLTLLAGMALLCLVPSAVSDAQTAAVWWTVVRVEGSDRLVLRDQSGGELQVQHIGLRGPTRSAKLYAEATAAQAQLIGDRKVRLETDGPPRPGEYALRQVYLDDGPLPLGVALVDSGWAVVTPYQIDQRYREVFLRAQEQAMAAQRGLRAPGVLGPVVPWRLSPSEPGYLAVDPALPPALDLLATVPTGRSVLTRLQRTAPTMLLRDMAGDFGVAEPVGYHIELNRTLLDLPDQRMLATVVAHEGTHLIDFVVEALGLAEYSCFETEQRAFAITAQVWSEYFGPNGKPNPAPAESSPNEVLRFAQRGDLANFVQRSEAYERQCASERRRVE